MQFNPVISCLSLTICFAIWKISFWHSESFKSFVHSCFFSFAEEITLFAFCLLFLYSFLASFVFSFFHFLYFIFLYLTASAISSFHHHVFLCLHGPFVIPHMSWAVSIIKPFICCHWSFTPRPFHVASSTLSLTMHAYSSHVFSSLSFHRHTLGSNFLCQVFVALNHMSITSSLCFGTHSSLEITLTLRTLALSSCRTITVLFTRPATCYQLGFLLRKQCVADD